VAAVHADVRIGRIDDDRIASVDSGVGGVDDRAAAPIPMAAMRPLVVMSSSLARRLPIEARP
jgi:hypothetical protein